MAEKITAMTELTTPDAGDLLHIIDDPAGTPDNKKITVANLLAGASGGATVLQSESPSDVATVDLTLSGSHRTYIIDGWTVPATDDADLSLRCDVGSGFDSGNNYGYIARIIRTAGGDLSETGGNTATEINVGARGADNGTNGGHSFRIIVQRAKVARYTDFISDVAGIDPTNPEIRYRGIVGGWHLNASAVTAVRLFYSSGNIAAGEIDLKVG